VVSLNRPWGGQNPPAKGGHFERLFHLGPGVSKSLIRITPKSKSTEANDYLVVLKSCQEILKNCEVNFEYRDIFDNTDSYKKSCYFLRSKESSVNR
jgi:hypothetical protein